MLFLGDDWAEAHHDIELQDEHGKVLKRRRLPEGVTGLTQLHELIADHLDDSDEPESVLVGIETDRGGWVHALIAAGYTVYAINPNKQPATANGSPPQVPRAIPATRMCWPRSSARTVSTTASWPGTVSWPKWSRPLPALIRR